MSTVIPPEPQDEDFLSKDTLHYLRNLLVPITGHASLLLSNSSLPASAKKALRDIDDAAGQMLEIIEKIDEKSRS